MINLYVSSKLQSRIVVCVAVLLHNSINLKLMLNWNLERAKILWNDKKKGRDTADARAHGKSIKNCTSKWKLLGGGVGSEKGRKLRDFYVSRGLRECGDVPKFDCKKFPRDTCACMYKMATAVTKP